MPWGSGKAKWVGDLPFDLGSLGGSVGTHEVTQQPDGSSYQ